MIFRFFFGLLGAGLGVAGAVYFTLRTDYTGNLAMRLSLIALFGFLASFWLFNVALGRTWRWPAICLGLSFVAVFASRIFWGK